VWPMCAPAEQPTGLGQRHVDRSGEHHRWLGAFNPQRGTGKLRVGDRQVTAHRRTWELKKGEVARRCIALPCPFEVTDVGAMVECAVGKGANVAVAMYVCAVDLAGAETAEVTVAVVRPQGQRE